MTCHLVDDPCSSPLLSDRPARETNVSGSHLIIMYGSVVLLPDHALRSLSTQKLRDNRIPIFRQPIRDFSFELTDYFGSPTNTAVHISGLLGL